MDTIPTVPSKMDVSTSSSSETVTSTKNSNNPIIQVLESLQLGTQFGTQMIIQYFRKVLTPDEFDNPFLIRTYPSPSSHRVYRVLCWFLEMYDTLPHRHVPSTDARGTIPSSSSVSTTTKNIYCHSVRNPPNPWQKGCPEIIPYLLTQPWWLPNASWTVPSTLPSSSPLVMRTSADITPDHPYYSKLAFIHELEAATSLIRQEVLALRGQSVFQTYRAPDYKENTVVPLSTVTAPSSSSTTTLTVGADIPEPGNNRTIGTEGTDRGLWNIYYLDLHQSTSTIDKEKNERLCPVTMSILKRIPRLYGHAMFSAMAPNTHITTHTGPTNRKLRIHLPLFVPGNNDNKTNDNNNNCPHYCRLRVGPHTEIFKEGSCVIFDDSFQHEAWNDYDPSSPDSSSSSSTILLPSRINLIIDIWHPDLTEEEIKILNFIRSSQIRKAKAMSEAGIIPAEADFFKILQESHKQGIDDRYVFGPSSQDMVSTERKTTEDGKVGTNNGMVVLSATKMDNPDSDEPSLLQPLESVGWKDD